MSNKPGAPITLKHAEKSAKPFLQKEVETQVAVDVKPAPAPSQAHYFGQSLNGSDLAHRSILSALLERTARNKDSVVRIDDNDFVSQGDGTFSNNEGHPKNIEDLMRGDIFRHGVDHNVAIMTRDPIMAQTMEDLGFEKADLTEKAKLQPAATAPNNLVATAVSAKLSPKEHKMDKPALDQYKLSTVPTLVNICLKAVDKVMASGDNMKNAKQIIEQHLKNIPNEMDLRTILKDWIGAGINGKSHLSAADRMALKEMFRGVVTDHVSQQNQAAHLPYLDRLANSVGKNSVASAAKTDQGRAMKTIERPQYVITTPDGKVIKGTGADIAAKTPTLSVQKPLAPVMSGPAPITYKPGGGH